MALTAAAAAAAADAAAFEAALAASAAAWAASAAEDNVEVGRSFGSCSFLASSARTEPPHTTGTHIKSNAPCKLRILKFIISDISICFNRTGQAQNFCVNEIYPIGVPAPSGGAIRFLIIQLYQ
jgi:hypothetical protein